MERITSDGKVQTAKVKKYKYVLRLIASIFLILIGCAILMIPLLANTDSNFGVALMFVLWILIMIVFFQMLFKNIKKCHTFNKQTPEYYITYNKDEITILGNTHKLSEIKGIRYEKTSEKADNIVDYKNSGNAYMGGLIIFEYQQKYLNFVNENIDKSLTKKEQKAKTKSKVGTIFIDLVDRHYVLQRVEFVKETVKELKSIIKVKSKVLEE